MKWKEDPTREREKSLCNYFLQGSRITKNEKKRPVVRSHPITSFYPNTTNSIFKKVAVKELKKWDVAEILKHFFSLAYAGGGALGASN